MVGLEKLGAHDSSVIKASSTFGGGIGGPGRVCGALVGAASVIGTLYGRSSLEEKAGEGSRPYLTPVGGAVPGLVSRLGEGCEGEGAGVELFC